LPRTFGARNDGGAVTELPRTFGARNDGVRGELDCRVASLLAMKGERSYGSAFVITSVSEAIQLRASVLDCFVAALLAMTVW